MLENARQQILQILRNRRFATVEELCRELDLASATVRRHLDILLRDDLVSVSQVRGGAGRPHYAFSLTEKGAETFPHHYVRFANRIVDELVVLDPGETEGKTGAQLADLLFERMAGRLAASYAEQITGEDVYGRAQQAVRVLEAEGLRFEVGRDDQGLTLTGRGCPCSQVLDGHPQFCLHDQRLIEQLIGAPLERIATETGENVYCRFRVREEAARGLSRVH